MNEHDGSAPIGDPIDDAALRYVLGDLPDREQAAFEKRLADDQDAREALASMVMLVSPGATPDRGYRRAVRLRLQWGDAARLLLSRPRRLLAGVATGAVAATLFFALRPVPTPVDPVMPASQSPVAVVYNEEPAPATVYINVSGIDRLERIHQDRAQRQSRREDFRAHHPIFDMVRQPMMPMMPMMETNAVNPMTPPMNPMNPMGPMGPVNPMMSDGPMMTDGPTM